MRSVSSRIAAGLVAASLALVGCGSGDGDDGAGGTDGGQEVAGITVTEDTDVKPEFDVPTGEAPPEELVVETLVEGDGEEAEAGDQVQMKYVGKSWSTGEQFDASWDRNPPQDIFSFELGKGRVIQGWDEGVAGMKVGERRMLIIPPDKAYGSAGIGPIGPNETLVFVVDLIAIG